MTLVFSEAMPGGLYAPKPSCDGALRSATTHPTYFFKNQIVILYQVRLITYNFCLVHHNPLLPSP